MYVYVYVSYYMVNFCKYSMELKKMYILLLLSILFSTHVLNETYSL